MKEYKDCLSCSNSYSIEGENGESDKLYCVIKKRIVEEDGICDEYN